MTPSDPDVSLAAIRSFVRLDRLGAGIGLVLVIVANGLVVQEPSVWPIAVVLALLIGCLSAASALVRQGNAPGALVFVMLGNWVTAFAVAIVLPFLWPVMVLTSVMPLVLATPFLRPTWLTGAIIGSSVAVAAVAIAGLLLDDEGVIEDIDDSAELVIVVGGLVAQAIPFGLIVWQNNRLQREALDQATTLNRDLLRSQVQLGKSRRRVVEAADVERSRIERDLHDGAQQRLVALGMRLRLLDSQTENSDSNKDALQGLVAELDHAVEELRELAHGIYPPLLAARGLSEALAAVGRRTHGVEVSVEPVGRFDPAIETAFYFTALEALANVAKHAPDAAVRLDLSPDGPGAVVLEIADDGPGFAVDSQAQSRGLLNMADRIAAVGGALTIVSSPGSGTTIRATFSP